MASKKVIEFEGYQREDITYCIDPKTNQFFPVRVIEIDRKFLDVEPMDNELTEAVSVEFLAEIKNRRFVRPKLPSISRFGGFDERIVNTDRLTGQELRLLPFHYNTYTNAAIKELHGKDPVRWPLPTGTLFERWFKDRTEDT